jgi:HD-GYP domain-containing protein (c-di-GMP phosphodiesterase class II)
LDTVGRSIIFSQRRQLESFGERLKKFGVNFAVCDVNGQLILLCDGGRPKSSPEQLIEYSRQALSQNGDKDSPEKADVLLQQLGDSSQVLATVLKFTSGRSKRAESVAVALIDMGDISTPVAHYSPDDMAGMNAAPANIEYLTEMLWLLAESFQAAGKAEEQIEKVGTELSQTYEELVLLHKLSTNMKVTEQDTSFLQMACDNLTAIVSVEGIAILVEKLVDNEPQLAVAAGSGLIEIDERMAAILHSRLTEQVNNGKEALLDSEVDAPFRYDWPDNIKNIIAVPLFGKEKTESHFASRTKNGNNIIGLLVAINRIDKPDFDSTDVKLFSSVAGSCAVFIENGRLFTDLKELFIGSLKALTSSIDAKDQYTRGHSERVAFISRWIAERLVAGEQLEEEQIHRIYLAGLLHDIGKIGIDEAVLRKNGKLTEQELDRVRKHPSIGAGILSAIKQMRDIVPTVLCHHERIDGKGYPAGLVGNQVPLGGKIVGLADSFDAMTSKRTYRDARTVEEALVEIEKGIGTQFDEQVARAFLNSDVYHLWDTIRDGFCEINGSSSFAEYGTAAVGTLIG